MRVDGYLPLRAYAAIGDGRTCALVGSDGSIDWLCLPNVDSAPVFDRILDADGGCFELRPAGPFETDRRYREGTNVLETTFRTDSGAVRVTDALTLHDTATIAPLRELVRVVDGVEGRVELQWRFEPRLDFGRRALRRRRHSGADVAVNRKDAFALSSWDAGDGAFALEAGERTTFSLTHAHGEPLVLPAATTPSAASRKQPHSGPTGARG
jgi:GH15 family glucan-1,4-alpha-glucosidase